MTAIHLKIYLQRQHNRLSIRLMETYEKLPDGLPEFRYHFYQQNMVENRSVFNMLLHQYRQLSGSHGLPCSYDQEETNIEREISERTNHECRLMTLPLSADIRECLLMLAAVDGGLQKFQHDESHVHYISSLADFRNTIDIINQTQTHEPQIEKIFSRECAAWLIDQIKEFPDELVEYRHIRLILEAMLRVEQGSLSDAIQQFLRVEPSVEDTRPEYMQLLPQPVKHITPEELKHKRVDVNQFIIDHPAENGLLALTPDLLKFSIGRGQGLNSQDVKSLAMTSRALHRLFQPEVIHRAVTKLLLHVVHGEQADVEKMVMANPRLLVMSGSIIDYSGRRIQGVTALQCAFGAEDLAMYDMLLSHLVKLADGGKIASKQINVKFSHSLYSGNPDEDILENLAISITKDPCHDNKALPETQQLLDFFRKKFMPGVIETGHHFDIRNLFVALSNYKLYFNRWNVNQRRLYWIQVVGYIESLLPANYAQDLCQGLLNVVKFNEPPRRSLKLFNGDSYYSLDTHSSQRLGHDFAVYSEQILNADGIRMVLPGQTVIPDQNQAAMMYFYLWQLWSSKTLGMSQRHRDLKQYESYFQKCTIC